MQVDRTGYLMFITSFAIGGVGGYVASEKDMVPHLSPRPASTPAAVTAEPMRADAGPAASAAPVAAPVVDAGPACDDSSGEVDACPPIGLPTVEGGCGGYANTRCNDFKQTMKPRVAKAAVACLNKLNGSERCDPKRVDLCAHLALMSACEDNAPGVTQSCDAIAVVCKGAPIPPSIAECRRAMSGLKEVGRESMLDCTKKHCADKGVLGCESTGLPKQQ
jgi:hypothetical protein